jgi:NAD(P)-dependent dehydrogenase (short-subunit alcohol dehydrogenase family)
VVVEQLDLASFDSVKKFAERIDQNENRVSLLINNAGKQIATTRNFFDQLGN